MTGRAEAAVGDHQDPTLEEAGLVIVQDEGKRYDRFRDRVMFPIRNEWARSSASAAGHGQRGARGTRRKPRLPQGPELYGLQ